MKLQSIDHQSGTATFQITVDLHGSLFEVEQKIQDAVNAVGAEATRLAIEQFDTDGSPIQTGDIKWTRRCRSPKLYHTPYGTVEVERNVYQISRGGKSYVPLEADARIISCSTPKFSKMISSKYSRLMLRNCAMTC